MLNRLRRRVLTRLRRQESRPANDLVDWRTHFARRVSGRGVELGPLHRPMVRHDGMQVVYVDKLTVPELRRHYPELNDLDLVAPDILDDAGTLASIPDGSYDFVIAAHIIEHLTDPIGALGHWCRVLRPQGLVYLVVPDKRFTFDRQRACTSLEHMLLDYVQPSADRDYEHYLDYAVRVHGKRGLEAIEEARRLHDQRYSIHMHVFTPADVVELLAWFARHVRPVEVLEGPRQNPESDEFHLLVRAS